MKKKKLAKLLWKIYLECCSCDMDYHSNGCRCEARFTVECALDELLGPNWHKIMRKKVKE